MNQGRGGAKNKTMDGSANPKGILNFKKKMQKAITSMSNGTGGGGGGDQVRRWRQRNFVKIASSSKTPRAIITNMGQNKKDKVEGRLLRGAKEGLCSPHDIMSRIGGKIGGHGGQKVTEAGGGVVLPLKQPERRSRNETEEPKRHREKLGGTKFARNR